MLLLLAWVTSGLRTSGNFKKPRSLSRRPYAQRESCFSRRKWSGWDLEIPKNSVASVAGFGGTWGYIGASLFQVFVGYMVKDKGNYTVPFLCAGLAYLIAFGVIHAFAPRIAPIQMRKTS